MEIDRVSNMGYGLRFFSTPYEDISKIKIADDDAGAAVISHSGRPKLPSPLEHIKGGTGAISSVEMLRRFGSAPIQSLATFEELSELVGAGRWSPEALRSQVKEVRSAADTPWRDIWKSFFEPSTESVSKGYQYSVCPDTSVERGMYALSWLRDNSSQALQCQGNLDSQRVLKLLTR